MADLNQFLNKDLTAKDVAHSNAYGSVAGGGGAGGLSLERRRQLEYQHRIVKSYRHSQLGRQLSSSKSRTVDQQRGRVYDASSDTFSDRAGYSKSPRKQADNTQNSGMQRRTFTEPTRRSYDKFA